MFSTTLRNNSALDTDGGGLNVTGTVVISNSQILNNSASGPGNGGGGGLKTRAGSIVNIIASRLASNSTNLVTGRKGGAILNDGTLYIVQSTLSGNTSADGGAIANNTAVDMWQTSISGNEATQFGGGIHNFGVVNMIDSTLSTNTALSGAGIMNKGRVNMFGGTVSQNNASADCAGIDNEGLLYVIRSTLNQNNAGDSGGAICNHGPGGEVQLLYSTLYNNSAAYGGGIFNRDDLTVVNSTLSGNTASEDGGGIYNSNGIAQIINSTIVYNGADSDANNNGVGGGLFNDNANGANTYVRNSLLAGNDALNHQVYNECYGTFYIFGTNRLGIEPNDEPGCTLIPDGYASRLKLNTLNWLGPLQNNGGPTWTHALLRGSNAIDIGGDVQYDCVDVDASPLQIDQRGVPRVLDGNNDGLAKCDIGAFEYRPPLYLPLIQQ